MKARSSAEIGSRGTDSAGTERAPIMIAVMAWSDALKARFGLVLVAGNLGRPILESYCKQLMETGGHFLFFFFFLLERFKRVLLPSISSGFYGWTG
jgi:hypothetical protein